MKLKQVAIQLYTLRDFCKTAADFVATARKVKHIGYDAVQISGVGPIATDELVRICSGEGLVIAATHESGKDIVDNTGMVIDRLHALGTRYTAYPHPHLPLTTIEEVLALAAALDKAGKAMRKAGQVLTYHKTMLEIFYEQTGRTNLQGEIDTYWIQCGGGDPVEWCRYLKRRLPLLHMKDQGVNKDNKAATMMEIGHGNLNWPAIISAAERSGCEWFIVEQDVCPGDPFESIRESFRYIKEKLVEKSSSAAG